MIISQAEEGEMFMTLKDWRKAVRTPPSYRVGKNVQRYQKQVICIALITSILLLYLFYSSDSKEEKAYSDHDQLSNNGQKSYISTSSWMYNATYPLSKPVNIHDSFQFKIGLISDMDHSSRSKLESNTWISYYLQGSIMWNPTAQTISVTFDKNNFRTLKTKFSHNGRGLELSEIVTFDGKLITFDDRSGIVYLIDDNKVYPWVLLVDGDGKSNKGFKGEWAAVKDEHLYVGSMGKEWTTSTGEFVSYGPMWVKRISPTGEVVSLDWKDNYIALRSKLNIHFPGYLLHESGVWSEVHKKWFFLPRRMSHDQYNEETDEKMGTNVLLISDELFKNIKVVYVGEVMPTHGFSSFKFIPGTKDKIILALKTMEYNGQIATYIMAFNIEGKIILGETKIDDTKYEGIEFI